jgi:hypothetical protein
MTQAKPTSNNIHQALCVAQAEYPAVPKNMVAAKGTPREYKYADLPMVLKTILPCLNKQGVVYLTEPFVDGIMLMLKASLVHAESGTFVECTYPVCGVDSAPQQVGSALTYSRRYTFQCLTGCAPDDDNDATGIGAHEKGIEGTGRRTYRRWFNADGNEVFPVMAGQDGQGTLAGRKRIRRQLPPHGPR